MSADFHFAWPFVFLLLPLPWLVARFLRPLPPPQSLRLPALAAYAASAAVPAPRPGGTLLAGLIWLLLLCAAARPLQPDPQAPLPVSGRSLMLAVDLSASMATRDLALDGRPVERLVAAKALARDFLARRGGDRVGLLVFGRQAYVHVPPTLDLQAVADALDTAAVGLAGNETALGEAIALATKQLRGQPEAARTLVLLTDGANTAGTLTPQRAAWLAQREGIRIHAVGIGGGQPERGGLDEAALQAVAAPTGGHYQRATDARALAEFFQRIAALEPVAAGDATRRPVRELAPLFLAAALPLALVLAWRLRQAARRADTLWLRAIDAHLRPHVVASSPQRHAAALPWHLVGLLGAALLLAQLFLDARADRAAYRADALRVIVAELSSPERDAALRARLLALLAQLPPGETALVIYAGDAYLAVPPTRDPDNIAALAAELAAGIMPVAGRDLARARQFTEAVLARSAARRRSIIWLTPTPGDIAPLPTPAGVSRHVLDIDAGMAQTMQAIGEIQARLAAATPWRLDGKADLPDAPLLPALAPLALLPFAAWGFRRGGLAVLPAPVFLLLLPLAGASLPADAAEDDPRWLAVAQYRAGRYEETARLLAARDDAVSLYNRGNALARLGRYAEAETAYAASLRRRPGDADTQFNLELVRRLRASAQGRDGHPPPADDPAPAEAGRTAEQWLRGVPDAAAGLLRARLRLEHQRRLAAAGQAHP